MRRIINYFQVGNVTWIELVVQAPEDDHDQMDLALLRVNDKKIAKILTLFKDTCEIIAHEQGHSIMFGLDLNTHFHPELLD